MKLKKFLSILTIGLSHFSYAAAPNTPAAQLKTINHSVITKFNDGLDTTKLDSLDTNIEVTDADLNQLKTDLANNITYYGTVTTNAADKEKVEKQLKLVEELIQAKEYGKSGFMSLLKSSYTGTIGRKPFTGKVEVTEKDGKFEKLTILAKDKQSGMMVPIAVAVVELGLIAGIVYGVYKYMSNDTNTNNSEKEGIMTSSEEAVVA